MLHVFPFLTIKIMQNLLKFVFFCNNDPFPKIHKKITCNFSINLQVCNTYQFRIRAQGYFEGLILFASVFLCLQG